MFNSALGKLKLGFLASAVGVCLVACSTAAPPKPTPEPIASDWQEMADAQWAELLKQFPDAERPHVEFIAWTSKTFGADSELVHCLNDIDISGTGADAEEKHAVLVYTCMAQYPIKQSD